MTQGTRRGSQGTIHAPAEPVSTPVSDMNLPLLHLRHEPVSVPHLKQGACFRPSLQWLNLHTLISDQDAAEERVYPLTDEHSAPELPLMESLYVSLPSLSV